MIYLGKNIQSAQDHLEAVDVEKVYKAILNSKGEVATAIARLRSLLMIDPNVSKKIKISLPYLVCANFHPKFRKKENFLFTEYFFLDLDHFQGFDRDIEQVFQKLKEDPRVVLLFRSPSGDGLKVLFRLKERINDSAYYSLFYKSFAMKFAIQYELNGIVDLKTSDVSRCCFVSYDSEAFWNPIPEWIDADEYLPKNSDTELFNIKNEIKQTEKQIKSELAEKNIQTAKVSQELPNDILNQIKIKVGVRVKKEVKKTFIQPKELDELIPELMEELKEIDIELRNMIPISYGRQIRVGVAQHWAELNVFYGKKGVNIIKTTKSGSNSDLADLVQTYLRDKFQNKIIED